MCQDEGAGPKGFAVMLPMGDGDVVHVHNAIDAMQVGSLSPVQRR